MQTIEAPTDAGAARRTRLPSRRRKSASRRPAHRHAAPPGAGEGPPVAGARPPRLVRRHRDHRRLARRAPRRRELDPPGPLHQPPTATSARRPPSTPAPSALPEDAFVYGAHRAAQRARRVPGVRRDRRRPRARPRRRCPRYATAYVDPGTGEVNGVQDDDEGATHWLYRGHEYLWQDYGVFGAFDPETGWCRQDADGHEPGGAKGVACDVLPDGMDLIGWFSIGFIVVLLTGFYLWYWPGVRRWATALVVQARTRALRLPPVAAPGGGPRVLGAAADRRVHRRRLRLPEHEQVVRERHPGPARLRPVGAGGGAGARGRRSRADHRRRGRGDRRGALPRAGHPLRRACPTTRPAPTSSGSPAASTRGPARAAPATSTCCVDQYTGEIALRRHARRTATCSTRRGTTGASRSTPATSAAPSPGCSGWPSASRPSSSPSPASRCSWSAATSESAEPEAANGGGRRPGLRA